MEDPKAPCSRISSLLHHKAEVDPLWKDILLGFPGYWTRAQCRSNTCLRTFLVWPSRFGGHPHRCKYTRARPTVYHRLFKTCVILRNVDNNAVSEYEVQMPCYIFMMVLDWHTFSARKEGLFRTSYPELAKGFWSKVRAWIILGYAPWQSRPMTRFIGTIQI